MTVRPQLFELVADKVGGSSKWGAIMYTLKNIDFSNWSGVVVSELPSDAIDRQDQTLAAKLGDVASTSSPAKEQEMTLGMAVFGAP